MALITAAIVSIFGITAMAWFLNRFWPWRICAICAGVSLTWLWMIGARLLGYAIDMIVPAVLMGGSVVGLAYQLENKLPPRRSPLLWKTLFIPVGFLAVLYLLLFQWLEFSLALIILGVIGGGGFFFFWGVWFLRKK